MSSLPMINSLVKKNRLFKTAPDIDEPQFQFIHIMDLSVVDTMLHNSSDLVIHRIGIWAVWWPQLGCKRVWRFLAQQFNCCTCAAHSAGALHCPAGTKLLPDTSLWRREAASKKSVRDITRISCFVTTMKYRMHCRFFCEEVYAVAFFQGNEATNYR